MDKTTSVEQSVEQELTDLVESLDIDSLKAYFTDILTASVEDDPNSESQKQDEEAAQ